MGVPNQSAWGRMSVVLINTFTAAAELRDELLVQLKELAEHF